MFTHHINGFASITILLIMATMATLIGTLTHTLKASKTTILNYQHYIVAYYNADAGLKLGLDRLDTIPTLDKIKDKKWLYDHAKTGLDINPFNTAPVYLFRYNNLIFAVSPPLKTEEKTRLILIGTLDDQDIYYHTIYAYDRDHLSK